MLGIEIERDGRIHPCNGYILVEEQEEHTSLIIVRKPGNDEYHSGVCVELSGDETDPHLDVKEDGFEWKVGDLIYFSSSIEVDSHMFVHWTDVVAYRRIDVSAIS